MRVGALVLAFLCFVCGHDQASVKERGERALGEMGEETQSHSLSVVSHQSSFA